MTDTSIDSELNNIVEKIFAKYDIDKNLVLDESELQLFVKDEMGKQATEEELKKLLALLDQNNDKKVSKEEVFLFLKKTFQP